MKITLSQLKRIIKEEVGKEDIDVLYSSLTTSLTNLADELEFELYDPLRGAHPDDVKVEIRTIIQQHVDKFLADYLRRR